MIVVMFFVFDLQSWDESMVHAGVAALHVWVAQIVPLRDVCMFACALLLTLDLLVYACFMC